ncbi:hypothetical protein [Schleiferilactobacillus harbinensis]|uniref:hypothetical protein n=1 Tax=Schleiferilactobacillus harbinensis TaxID=304207 RepID=UPI0021A8EAB0|nr:hypothetical protein [Schleiferilactobacillus harbinensis]
MVIRKQARQLGQFLVVSLVLTILATWPIFTWSNFHIIGSLDAFFHFNRISGITEALRQGRLYNPINTVIMDRIGYPVNLFYSDFTLYPAAILHACGVGLVTSYKIWIFGTTWVGILLNFYAFKLLFRNFWFSFVPTTMYMMSTYRLYLLLDTGTIGQAAAFNVAPLAIIAFYLILTRRESHWLALGLSVALLMVTHIISTLVVVGGLVLLAIFHWRQFFTRAVMLEVVKAVGICVLLAAFFIGPFLEQYTLTTYKSANTIWKPSKAAVPLLISFKQSLFYPETVSKELHAYNYGWLLVLPIVVRVVALLSGSAGRHWLSADPWLLFGYGIFGLTGIRHLWRWADATVFQIVQFPARLMTIGTLFLVLGCCECLVGLLRNRLPGASILVLTVAALTVVNAQIYLRAVQTIPPYYSISNATPLKRADWIGSGQEYIPMQTDLYQLTTHNYPLVTEGIEISHYQRNDVRYQATYRAVRSGTISLPVLAYRGFHLYVNNREQTVTHDGQFRIAAQVKPGTGTVETVYRITVVQIVSLLISGVTVGGLLLQAFLRRREFRADRPVGHN